MNRMFALTIGAMILACTTIFPAIAHGGGCGHGAGPGAAAGGGGGWHSGYVCKVRPGSC